MLKIITDRHNMLYVFRCKRLHLLLATAYQVLHFHTFLDNVGPLPESLKVNLAKLKQSPSSDLMETIERSADFQAIMTSYTEYTTLTLSGQHGNTAKF